MKLAIATLVFAGFALAGPLKVASYPVLHPKKDVHAMKATGKGLFKAVKAVVW